MLIASEEMTALVDFFNYEISDPLEISEDVFKILKRMSEETDQTLHFVRCQCGAYFNNEGSEECPSCGGWYCGIEIGTKVRMPASDFDNGKNWTEGEICVVTGFETIDDGEYLIVLGNDNRSWCVLREDVTIED